MYQEKSMTYIGLIFVVFLVVMFVSILFPAMQRSTELALQIHCAANLSGLGKALAVYQHDFMGSNPVLWGKDNEGHFGMGLYNKYGQNENTRWIDPNFRDWESQPTVGGCLFLLVKYAYITPDVFRCESDENAVELTMDEAVKAALEKGWSVPQSWMQVNDFQTGYNNSYSYNDPWKAVLHSASAPELVVLADKSPAYNTETVNLNQEAGEGPLRDRSGGWSDYGRNLRPGNTPNHDYEVQNVLFTDSHVKKHNSPTVGIDKDNIYTYWPAGAGTPAEQKQDGRWDQGHAASMEDSYLGN